MRFDAPRLYGGDVRCLGLGELSRASTKRHVAIDALHQLTQRAIKTALSTEAGPPARLVRSERFVGTFAESLSSGFALYPGDRHILTIEIELFGNPNSHVALDPDGAHVRLLPTAAGALPMWTVEAVHAHVTPRPSELLSSLFLNVHTWTSVSLRVDLAACLPALSRRWYPVLALCHPTPHAFRRCTTPVHTVASARPAQQASPHSPPPP